jgi:hypothetical protein
MRVNRWFTVSIQREGVDVKADHPTGPPGVTARVASPSGTACGACGAPTADGGLCHGCVDGSDVDISRTGMRDLLDRLTAHVIGAQEPGRTPLRMTITKAGATTRSARRAGYGRSTAWDTPRGEAANFPRMLREATARQTSFAAETGQRRPSCDAPSLRVDHRAGDHLAKLQRVVARMVIDTMRASGAPPPFADGRPPTWGAVARWLDTQMPVVRVQTWAPTTLADLRRVMAAAERHVDRPPARQYLGPCTCGGEVWARDGETVARCLGRPASGGADEVLSCRAEVDVATRRGQLRDQAAEMWLTAREVERLTAFLGMRVPASTVSTLHQRRKIVGSRPWSPSPDPAAGPVRYLLRDVLAIVEARESRTRRTA